ncbi:MAG: hypothetical protein CSA65_04020 [Proteobacteria bacterium]|nr:MAG: hypothetical protein CSA65_04020 [Pseudomonadota bacterium]
MRIAVLIKAARALPDAPDRLPALAPGDAAALAWAAALAGDDDETIAITAGPASADPALERALDHGVHRAMRIWVPDPDVQLLDANVRGVAELLAATVRHVAPIDLVLCGARSADWSTGITGPAVAFELDVPHVSFLSSIQRVEEQPDADGQAQPTIRFVQHHDTHLLECELRLPALLSVISAPAKLVEGNRRSGAAIEVLMADEVGFEADDPLPWPALPTVPEEGGAQRVGGKELLALLQPKSDTNDGADLP